MDWFTWFVQLAGFVLAFLIGNGIIIGIQYWLAAFDSRKQLERFGWNWGLSPRWFETNRAFRDRIQVAANTRPRDEDLN